MFQTHCYDSWLGGRARQGTFFVWSQLGGTLPAPLFLFLAGISSALIIARLRQKGTAPNQIAGLTIRRGAEILAFGLLFRLQEFVLAWGWAPWSDLLRVDILNVIGVSLMLLGLLTWLVLFLMRGRPSYLALGLSAAAAALIVALLTPLLWTSWRPHFLPWPLESYINGVHNLGKPQSYLFPVFPWAGFAFAGLAVGMILIGERARRHPGITFAAAGAGGAGLICLARWLDARPEQLYASYDFWHTSPNFFLLRVGLLLLILSAVYAWCRWGVGQRGFSPFLQLGQTSLLVYWVHIEFVYGRFSILPKRSVSVRTASLGLLAIILAMLLLSMLRTRWKNRGAEAFAWPRGPLRAN
jgi:uncharacterized membrane protein